jgi:CRISPR-associated protein Cmr1
MDKKVWRVPVYWGMTLLNPLLKVKFWNSSPLLLGGYDTESKHEFQGEELRPTSLKGVWRWWFRAVLGATLWRDGIKDEDFINNLRKKEGAILGTTEGKATASKIVIRSFTSKVCYDFAEKIQDLPRIRYLLLKKKDITFIKDIAGIIELKVFSYKDEKPEYEDIRRASGSFIISLLLSGLGKGSRRGFGSLDFDVIEDTAGMFLNLKSENIDAETIKMILRSLIPASESKNPPPIPLLAPGHFELLYLKHNNVMKMLQDIQNFTLRTGRMRVLGRDSLRDQLTGWILGLPRSAMPKGRIESGYYIKGGKIARRASPLIVSVHKTYASVCIFKSRDWPHPILWKSREMREGVKAQDDLMKAHDVLSRSIREYLEKCGYRYEEVKVF